jgi:hypothetical protein
LPRLGGANATTIITSGWVGRVREERWGRAPLELFGPFIVRPNLSAGDRGGAGENDAEADQEERNGTVEQTFEAMEGHDLNSYLWISPRAGRAVRSGHRLDSTYLNVVKIIFTAFGLSFMVTA